MGKWFSGSRDDGVKDKATFKGGNDKNDGGFRQDKLSKEPGESKHEHTFSKSSGQSKEAKEGWHGKDFKK